MQTGLASLIPKDPLVVNASSHVIHLSHEEQRSRSLSPDLHLKLSIGL